MVRGGAGDVVIVFAEYQWCAMSITQKAESMAPRGRV